MKILFHLGHPAHYHLFKNVIERLNKHDILIIIKKKDVLEELIKDTKYSYINILPDGRGNSIVGIAIGQIKQNYYLYKIARKFCPNIMIGTSVAISHIGTLLNIPSINVNEDDAKIVPLHAYLSYPFSTQIVSPVSCNNEYWQDRTIYYNGNHELAYLHPKYFSPNIEIVKKYFSPRKPYFILRFAKLTAHHDKGARGINTEIANKLIKILKPHGDIYITSERELESGFEQYRLKINPIDIHHVMSFAKMYIGDSQSMAAEAAVLGVPSIRYNDFVGKLGYLEELEHKYGLTYGINPSHPEKLIEKISLLLSMKNLNKEWNIRRSKMLKDKIDVTAFMVWFVENYPSSMRIMKKNPVYQYRFK